LVARFKIRHAIVGGGCNPGRGHRGGWMRHPKTSLPEGQASAAFCFLFVLPCPFAIACCPQKGTLNVPSQPTVMFGCGHPCHMVFLNCWQIYNDLLSSKQEQLVDDLCGNTNHQTKPHHEVIPFCADHVPLCKCFDTAPFHSILFPLPFTHCCATLPSPMHGPGQRAPVTADARPHRRQVRLQSVMTSSGDCLTRAIGMRRGGALGFGLTFPNPKRALGAHGVPHWGSSAPAHHTHPLAMQPAGGAHASSSSIVARVLSADVSLARSRCACEVTGTAENTGNAHCTAVGSCHVKRSCRGSVWTTAASHSSTWSRTASVAMSLATS
jgi:hypothetical protein